MRTVTLPPIDFSLSPGGQYWDYVVRVDWPELQLTEQQAFDNALAYAVGGLPPHEDRAIFVIRVPYRLESSSDVKGGPCDTASETR
jgi:hypothetical protein